MTGRASARVRAQAADRAVTQVRAGETCVLISTSLGAADSDEATRICDQVAQVAYVGKITQIRVETAIPFAAGDGVSLAGGLRGEACGPYGPPTSTSEPTTSR